jgi:nitric oxide reductase NorD protein
VAGRRGGRVAELRRRARRAITVAHARIAAWQRPERTHLELDDVRRRLEILVAALYGHAVHIEAAPEPKPGLAGRIERLFTPRHLRTRPVAWTDGATVVLPARLDCARDDAAGAARYRLLALGQAERVARGTAEGLAAVRTPLERDLFLLRESVAVDARLATRVRGLRDVLAHARRASLAARPPMKELTPAERAVEEMARAALATPLDEAHATVAASTPADSLAWAREKARSMRGPYRGVAPVAHWGTVTTNVGPPDPAGEPGNPFAQRRGLVQVESRNAAPEGTGGESDRPDPASDAGEVADPRGAIAPQGAPDAEGAAPDDPARHRDGTDPGRAAPLHPDDEVSRPRADDDAPVDPAPGTRYPEWIHTEGRYRQRAVTVRETRAPEAEGSWPADVMRQHAALVRRIRERFEPLRAQRTRLGQQREGEELDIPACVQAIVDARTGHTPSDRLYVSVRPARRGMAICLLVDVSGSTDSPVAGGQRIIDVEKIAVLLASEAFDALGDSYALMTFSSRGAHDVRVATLKDFHELNGPAVRQRIAGMEPNGNTRLGAAVRHASARLARQPAGRRLLLILSDGRPNDIDYYHEAFGVEDARQAVNEARAQGTYPFCITIDQEAGPEYLGRVFGTTGHTILRHPEQLPLALVSVVRQLLAR